MKENHDLSLSHSLMALTAGHFLTTASLELICMERGKLSYSAIRPHIVFILFKIMPKALKISCVVNFIQDIHASVHSLGSSYPGT